MDQKRLLIAFVLSAVILFGWTYLFPPTPPQQNANSQQATSDATPTPAPTAQPTQVEQQSQPVAAAPDTTPQRTVTVSTPLYKVELDSRGAVVKSWIIKQNKEKDGQTSPLYPVAAKKETPQLLELVYKDGLDTGKAPLAISTGRADIDSALA